MTNPAGNVSLAFIPFPYEIQFSLGCLDTRIHALCSVIEWTQSPHFNIYSYVHMKYAFRIGSVSCAVVLLLLCCFACACAQLVSAQLCSAWWVVFHVLFHWKQNVCFDCLCILLHSRCIDAIWFAVIVLVFRPRYGFTIYIVAQNTAETHENTIRLVCVVFGAFR